jgi:hypothetical protein
MDLSAQAHVGFAAGRSHLVDLPFETGSSADARLHLH